MVKQYFCSWLLFLIQLLKDIVVRSSPSSTFYDGLDQLTTKIAAFERVHLPFCNIIVVFLLISVVVLKVEQMNGVPRINFEE